ncbi:hypothetical protein C2845_PM17G13190 [Panicum miliaceum]|uniref:FBD domain-containing protein n=1 Tax=Panicum miliaceum TaxID=4540 RepID=A0A3L6Q434_PANMI|nr:hypothetical protein C2845_PM17G13190 [Panicum miliaceum]
MPRAAPSCPTSPTTSCATSSPSRPPRKAPPPPCSCASGAGSGTPRAPSTSTGASTAPASSAAQAHAAVRRLSFHVPGGLGPGAAVDVLSVPAARRVEELRVTAPRYFWLGALPSETLRVLHVAGCKNITPAPSGAVFPSLAAVRLQGCDVPLSCLQRLSDAAPGLATLHLEGCHLKPVPALSPSEDRCLLRCPAVTALVLADCVWPRWVQGGMELDVPRLRCFRYKGFVERLSLKSQAPGIHLVDLHFIDEVNQQGEDQICDKLCVIFWQFVQNFCDAKALKVKLNFLIEHIGFIENKDQSELQSHVFFSNLGHLELEAPHLPLSKGTALAVARLLHCCPMSLIFGSG